MACSARWLSLWGPERRIELVLISPGKTCFPSARAVSLRRAQERARRAFALCANIACVTAACLPETTRVPEKAGGEASQAPVACPRTLTAMTRSRPKAVVRVLRKRSQCSPNASLLDLFLLFLSLLGGLVGPEQAVSPNNYSEASSDRAVSLL